MKINFAVSALTEIWHPDAKHIFAIDAYIPHVLERNGRGAEYSVVAAPPSRSSRHEMVSDHEFVDRKFVRYTEIFCQRLDELHGKGFGSEFWRKAMALALMRHVTLCYDLFKACEDYLDLDVHTCRLLDPSEFRYPRDFDEHRQIFQNTELGQEQMFSVYCSLFHPNQFTFWKPELAPSFYAEPSVTIKSAAIQIYSKFSALLREPSQFATRLLFKLFTLRKPHLAIIECSFAPEYVRQLLLKSFGRIQPLALPAMQYTNSPPDHVRRESLCREEPDFDRFDRFAFACLSHAFPRLFVEDFALAYSCLDKYFEQKSSLRWVVCEWWIGSSCSALAMAVAKHRGVRHLCNEHNYLSYFFVGSSLKYIVPMVDEFVTLGWSDIHFPGVTKGASLFPWGSGESSRKKEHDILMVCGLPLAHVPEVTSSYGDSGAYRALSYFTMNKRFLTALGSDTLKTLYFRSYPKALTGNWLIWDQAYALSAEIANVKSFDADSASSRELMKKSALVVVNYLSTAYLEAIIADIPTIVIWNQDTNLFSEHYSHVFDSLIEAEICQVDPDAAAALVNRIKQDPMAWWRSPKVQRGRRAFLDANIGDPEVMVDYLLKKYQLRMN